MFKFMEELKDLRRRQDRISKSEAAEVMAAIRLPKPLALISSYSIGFVVASVWLGSVVSSAAYLQMVHRHWHSEGVWLSAIVYSGSAVVFLASFVLIAGVFGSIGRGAIIRGKFPRLASHPIYALRRIYGTAWTQVFYFKPLYAVCLAIPFLRRLLLGLFGYRGSLNFTVYPDAWIRDLPLLRIGSGAYIANRCTMGTNLCLSDGSILVGACTVGERSVVGHMTVFGLDCDLGPSSELGVQVSLGVRVRTGSQVNVAPKTTIYHGTELGDRVEVGGCSIIGIKVRISSDVKIPLGAIIPSGSVIRNQDDADVMFSSENTKLRWMRTELDQDLRSSLDEHRRGS